MRDPADKSSGRASSFSQENLRPDGARVPGPTYDFGSFHLDPASHHLLRDDEAIPLPPKAFDLLTVLIENRGRVMGKRELMERIWPDTIVEEANLSQTIFVLRRALADGTNGSHYIATVSKVGYRFVASVVESDVRLVGDPQKRVDPILPRSVRLSWGWPIIAAMLALVISATAINLWWSSSTRPSVTGAAADAPIFETLTFGKDAISSARFTPDGKTVVYATWNGTDGELFTLRLGDLLPVALPMRVSLLIGGVTSAGDVLYRTSDANLVKSSLSGDPPRVVAGDVGLGADSDREGRRVAIAHRVVGGGETLEFPIGVPLTDTAGQFSDIRISPRSDAVAFIEHPTLGIDRGQVGVVDLAGHKRVLSDGWFHAEGLAWSYSGQEVWFTAGKEESANTIYAVTLDGRLRTLARLPSDVILHDVSEDGRALITRMTRRTAIIARLPGDSETRDVTFLNSSVVADMSPDGRTLLFWDRGPSGAGTYLHKLGNAVPIRLGDGRAAALSPDGRWALAIRDASQARLVLLPTGAGEPRVLDPGPVAAYETASWMPDGEAVFFVGSETGRKSKLYVQAVGGGLPRAVSPEGVRSTIYAGQPVSPDGRFAVVANLDFRLQLFTLVDGGSRAIPAAVFAERVLRWSNDGRSIFVTQPYEKPARIYRVDPTTGHRTVWRDFAPPDRGNVTKMVITPDGEFYAGSYLRRHNIQLFQVRGLR